MNAVRKVGRPRRKDKTELKGFRLPEYICRKLETYPNQTTTVTIALERHFDIDNKAKQWLYAERDKMQLQLNSINSQIEKTEKEETESEKKELELLEKYNDFTEYLNTVQPGQYNTERDNKRFGIMIENYKHFEEIQNKNNNGSFSIQDYKNLLRRGNA